MDANHQITKGMTIQHIKKHLKKYLIGAVTLIGAVSSGVYVNNTYNESNQPQVVITPNKQDIAEGEEPQDANTVSYEEMSKGAKKAYLDMENDKDEPEVISGTTRERIVCYNVENLFDTEDDPKNHGDDDFTPDGKYQWTELKYNTKLKHISTAIKEAGNGISPMIVGLVEMENKEVLEDLIHQDALKNHGYAIIHKNSRDPRGIDVALLYQKNKLVQKGIDWINCEPTRSHSNMREIMHCTFIIKSNNEKLHVFINHWPSMKDGEEETEPKRIIAATALRNAVSEVHAKEGENANIVIMGDFNSLPSSKSQHETLGVRLNKEKYESADLYNLLSKYEDNPNIGTHKFNQKWDVIDQVIVCANLLDKKNDIFTTANSAHICHKKFLLKQSNSGYYSPKRALSGYVWSNGYSDHLPVSLDLYIKQ